MSQFSRQQQGQTFRSLPYEPQLREYPSYTCLNLESKNLRDIDQEIFVSQTFSGSLIDDCSQFSVSVTRLSIPSNLIETYDIQPSEQYQIRMRFNDWDYLANANTFTYPLFNNNSDNSNLSTEEAGVIYGPQQFFSKNAMIDNINKCFSRIQKSFILANSALFPTTTQPYRVLSSNISDITSLVTYSTYQQSSTNLCQSPVMSSQPAGQVARKVVIKINNFQMSNGGNPYRVYFKTTDGQKVTLFNSSQNFTLNGLNREITFSDDAVKSIYEYTPNDTTNIYSPEQSLDSCKWSAGNGQFFLYIEASPVLYTWVATVDALINVYVDNTTYVDADFGVAPTVTLDSSTNKLVFNQDGNCRNSGTEIYFSNTLQNILRFDGYQSYDPTTSFYRMIPSTALLTDLTATLSLTQANSSVYQLQNIDRIVVESNLPCLGEASITNQTTNVPSNVLQDFVVNPTEDLGQLSYFYNTYKPTKMYDLMGKNNPLTGIQLQVYAIYENGTKVPVSYKPNEVFKIALSFFLKSRLL